MPATLSRLVHPRRTHHTTVCNHWVHEAVYPPCYLAQAYTAQGRLDDSASLVGESLVMDRRLRGNKHHSDVAASLHSLAQVYKARSRLDDSASLHEESLAMFRRIHGSEDHHDVAVSLHSLAHVPGSGSIG